jgi:UPF0755 protein
MRRLFWLALAAMAAGGAAYGYLVELWAELPNRGRGDEVVVDVPRGTGPRRLAKILEARGVVEGALRFELYTRIRRATPRIRAGRYLVRDDLSPVQVLARVARVGAGGALRVTVPEGKNIFQIGEILAAEGIVTADAFVRSARDAPLLATLGIRGDSAEGFLFPDTYDLVPGTSAADVVRRLHTNFQRKAAPLFATHAARITELDPIGVDARGVITLASLVEAEARLPDERPRVAAVFLNRLGRADFNPRYLNTDPAVAYGCRLVSTGAGACTGYSGDARTITRAMLQDPENPYNTYKRAGLPPGPVCNPGLPAIRAVLAPAPGDDLYFVARGDGSHAFARTLAEHTDNVRRYR